MPTANFPTPCEWSVNVNGSEVSDNEFLSNLKRLHVVRQQHIKKVYFLRIPSFFVDMKTQKLNLGIFYVKKNPNNHIKSYIQEKHVWEQVWLMLAIHTQEIVNRAKLVVAHIF